VRNKLKSTIFLRQKYGLKDNPFRDETAKKEWLDSWTDREEQVREWTRVMSNAVSSPTRRNYISFIVGDYGRGKTQSLLKICLDSEKYKDILTTYLNFKGEEKSKPGLDFVMRIFKSVEFESLKSAVNKNTLYDALKSLAADFDEVKNVLWAIFTENENRKLAQYFIKGELKPTKRQLEKLNILRKIDDVDIAKEYLAGFLMLLKKLGFQALVLAVDEFEYLFSLVPRSQYNIYLALLRGLVDFPLGLNKPVEANDIANMVFFVAVSEDAYIRLQDLEKQERSQGGPIQPLMDRVSAQIVLTAFDRKNTELLVENRLRFDRISGKFVNKPLIPFTQDFIDFVYKRTRGELRDIIKVCSQVLDYGLEKGATLLDAAFAQRALEERAVISFDNVEPT
jgi:hypothetical protein